VEVYQICTGYFSQVMHFIVAWLCAVQRGKGTGHPTPFNSWLSMPRGGAMGCAVCVFMSVCLHVHGGVGMHIWCQHCMRIQPAFGLITVRTHCRSNEEEDSYLLENLKVSTSSRFIVVLYCIVL
jgi:hypothetical protein